eukprot:sb/3476683/
MLMLSLIIGLCQELRNCKWLYCGYVGNLQESVPELAAFWMVSVILQLPLCLYSLLDSGALILPLEVSVNSILLLFVVAELVVSTGTIRQMSLLQETKFTLLHGPGGARPQDQSSE